MHNVHSRGYGQLRLKIRGENLMSSAGGPPLSMIEYKSKLPRNQSHGA